jgi:hypothetical protein
VDALTGTFGRRGRCRDDDGAITKLNNSSGFEVQVARDLRISVRAP